AAVAQGIVHLGVGAFHRAHQAVYVDRCLAAGDSRWGITGVSLRSPDTRDALAPQDGLYTLSVRDGSGERLTVVGSMLKLAVAPEDPAAVVARMADPATRIVTLTVTEKAYLRNAAGDLDMAHPDLAHDLAHHSSPRTVHGLLASALEQRRAAGLPPFTVLCCDNLPSNGATVRRLLLQFASAREKSLARWLEDEAAFPSTMVDRIVPATTDADRARISAALGLEDAWPIATEPFMQWVVEDNFTVGRPDWEPFGVEMTRDVRPYEEMKLRLLNGAHSGMAYLGMLAGRDYVSDAFADPSIRQVVDGLWAEAIPTLPADAGLDTAAYTAELSTRFANPALMHRLAQIGTDGSQKLPQRVFNTGRARMAAGQGANCMALVIAAWIACCEARGGALPKRFFTDPLDDRLDALLAGRQPSAETAAAVFALAGQAIAGHDPLRDTVADSLDAIRNLGVPAAIALALDRGFGG
ncbi:MAG: mannitol dehydrogenase family protein, partial [Rhizobiaceae bacterium]|nr:mannitol dehydrogenase family protein [Rhizobiaceae bacterium]